MQVGTREFDEIMESFERIYSHMRLDKDSKDLWRRGIIYQDGETNKMYRAFRHGYSLGRVA